MVSNVDTKNEKKKRKIWKNTLKTCYGYLNFSSGLSPPLGGFFFPTICRFSPPLRENDIKYMRSLLQAIFPMLLIGKITISLEKYIENKKFFF